MNALDPSSELMRLINGYQVSQALHVAAVLGVADVLKDGPRSSDAIAEASGAHPGSLYRLLRALATVGVFREDDNKEFSLTPIGACLTSDAVASRRNWARYIGRPGHWQVWGNLFHSIKSGEASYHVTHRMDSWAYRKNNADEQASFDGAMTANSLSQAHAVLEAYDFSKFGCIVDVGGGQGLLLKEILLAYPASRGVLFDQPQVVASAGEVLASPALAGRCKIVAGSFLESIPSGGDAYVMKFILHDWDDQKSISVLRACRLAMAPTATLVVIERVIGPPNQIPEGKFSDLNMLVSHGALERTREEFSDLFERAGFAMTEIITTRSPLSIILGKPTAAG
jgi:O-methyltransferase/methyltransferase family protein